MECTSRIYYVFFYLDVSTWSDISLVIQLKWPLFRLHKGIKLLFYMLTIPKWAFPRPIRCVYCLVLLIVPVPYPPVSFTRTINFGFLKTRLGCWLRVLKYFTSVQFVPMWSVARHRISSSNQTNSKRAYPRILHDTISSVYMVQLCNNTTAHEWESLSGFR